MSDSNHSTSSLLRSTSLTLTLSILGSSVLPVPYAFSRTGLLAGVLLSLLVAYANALTCRLLIQAAGQLRHDDYATLAETIAGKTGKVVTQLSLMLLLFGSFTGATALLGDVGKLALQGIFPDGAPGALVDHGGRGIMLVLVLAICLPLSLKTHMRTLDTAAMYGLIPLAILMLLIIKSAIAAGFPAVRSGEFPVWKVNSLGDLPEAVAILGYAFYCQPMLLPLLHDLPGHNGVAVLSKAVQISVMGVASSVYTIVGIFGASRYGQATQGDCLLNPWLGGKLGGLLNMAMAGYLALSAVPVQFALRYTIETLLVGEDAPESGRRQVACTVLPMMLSVSITCSYPDYAEKIFAVTGALPVALICYIIPTWLHIALYYNEATIRSRAAGAPLTVPSCEDGLTAPFSPLEDPLLGRGPHLDPCPLMHRKGVVQDVVVPVLVTVLMTVVSGFALWTSLKGFMGGVASVASPALLLALQ